MNETREVREKTDVWKHLYTASVGRYHPFQMGNRMGMTHPGGGDQDRVSGLPHKEGQIQPPPAETYPAPPPNTDAPACAGRSGKLRRCCPIWTSG